MEYYSAFKKEGISDSCYHVDEPWKCYAKWNKPDMKGQILCDSTYMTHLESYSKTKLPGAREREE